MDQKEHDAFLEEIRHAINKHSIENESNTPDFILAAFVDDVMSAWNKTVAARSNWYGYFDLPGDNLVEKFNANKRMLMYREQELLEIKGPCATEGCSLHNAHFGPCRVANTE